MIKPQIYGCANWHGAQAANWVESRDWVFLRGGDTRLFNYYRTTTYGGTYLSRAAVVCGEGF